MCHNLITTCSPRSQSLTLQPFSRVPVMVLTVLSSLPAFPASRSGLWSVP